MKQNARDSIIEEVARLEKELKLVSSEMRRAKSQEAIKNARQTSQSVRRQIRKAFWRKRRNTAGRRRCH